MGEFMTMAGKTFFGLGRALTGAQVYIFNIIHYYVFGSIIIMNANVIIISIFLLALNLAFIRVHGYLLESEIAQTDNRILLKVSAVG